jgi:hypothetical protein
MDSNHIFKRLRRGLEMTCFGGDAMGRVATPPAATIAVPFILSGKPSSGSSDLSTTFEQVFSAIVLKNKLFDLWKTVQNLAFIGARRRII